jgi:hypothetical protein
LSSVGFGIEETLSMSICEVPELPDLNLILEEQFVLGGVRGSGDQSKILDGVKKISEAYAGDDLDLVSIFVNLRFGQRKISDKRFGQKKIGQKNLDKKNLDK